MAQNEGSSQRRDIRPQVDDKFWFDTSKEMVEKSHTHIDSAADKLQTLVGWLWGIYTAGAAIGLALSKLSLPLGVIILIASPSVFLIGSYFLVSMVYSPSKFQFDPRKPLEIKSEYNRIAKRKYRIYVSALIVSIIAALLTASALITTSIFKQSTTTTSLQANLYKQELVISGQIASNTTNYIIKIKGPNIDKELLGITSSNGGLKEDVQLNSIVDSLDVMIQWTDSDNIVRSLQRVITQDN